MSVNIVALVNHFESLVVQKSDDKSILISVHPKNSLGIVDLITFVIQLPDQDHRHRLSCEQGARKQLTTTRNITATTTKTEKFKIRFTSFRKFNFVDAVMLQ